MSRPEGVCAKAAAATQASAAARQGVRFMRGRSAIAALDKLPILRCTLSTLSNRPGRAFFRAERASQLQEETGDRPRPPHARVEIDHFREVPAVPADVAGLAYADGGGGGGRLVPPAAEKRVPPGRPRGRAGLRASA